jgi:hypothetical protein
MANMHVAGSLALLTYRRSAAAALKPQLIYRCNPLETIRFAACFLACAMTLPMTAHAPNITRGQMLRERDVVSLHNEMDQIRSEADEKGDVQRLTMPPSGPKAQFTPHQPSNQSRKPEIKLNDSDCSIPSSIAQLLGEREILQSRSRCQRGSQR